MGDTGDYDSLGGETIDGKTRSRERVFFRHILPGIRQPVAPSRETSNWDRQPIRQLLRPLIDDRKPSARPAEPRVHDVVEDRAEAVAQTEVDEVGVRCRELAPAEQTLLIAQTAAREIELVANERYLTEDRGC